MAVTNHSWSSFEPKPFGRYVLLDKLAVGGMAEIYRAKTYGVDGFEKQLAIKRILPHCAADGDFIRMLVDEAKLTVLLSHANIVQVYDLGKVGEDYFISMEFIHGTNLRELMVRQRDAGGKIAEEVAVYIVSEISKGLDYAHRKTDSQGNPLHIVHRDISPQNVLISFEGEVKIVDFGIAKAAMNVSHTMAGILKGKIAYMSPEQALGKPIDHRTDIFSTGLILYELLTGERLFTGDTQFEVLNQIRTTRINTMMLPDHIPGPLKAILAKALAYNAKDRYQSAGDFQLDLTKYLYSSYIDFSPRQLSGLLKTIFASEMKRKELPTEVEDTTRSILVSQSGKKEDIVVHRPETTPGKRPVPTEAMMPEPTTSGTYGLAKEVARKPLGLVIGIPILAVLIAFLGYQFGIKKIFQSTPSTTESTKPSEPAGDQAPALGAIRIETNPQGAKIFVNENDTGLVSPATLEQLKFGEEYRIRLSKEFYKDAHQTVAVTSESPVTVFENLSPLAKGVIEIESTPTGAKIFLDDSDTGLVTPQKIENLEIDKPYTIKLQHPNYYEWTQTAALKNFDPLKLNASLMEVPPPPAVPLPTPPAPPAQEVAPPTPPVTSTPPSQETITPTPPPPTPPVVEEFGKLSITSTPKGAKVYLNGEDTGLVTPTTLEKLKPGRRLTLSLGLKGYEDWKQTVSVEKGTTLPLTASLKKEAPKPAPPVTKTEPSKPVEPAPAPKKEEAPVVSSGKPGSLSIGSEPTGADVFVNSEFRGKTPLEIKNVPSGSVKVAVNKSGYLRETKTIKLNPGESKSLGTWKLGSFFGEIRINSQPPRATVIFDGDTMSRTPVTIRKVPRDKKHTIRIQLDGYRDWETTVNLNDTEFKKFDVQLEKK